jgi:hypothetical protein
MYIKYAKVPFGRKREHKVLIVVAISTHATKDETGFIYSFVEVI